MVMNVGQDVGSYRLVAEISHGRYAIVYQAVHRILSSRVVALKLLYTARLHGEDDQEDFFREARILAELQHPHILPLVDADIYEGVPFIMTEFATHGSLRSRLNRQPSAPLPVSEALAVLNQVGEALHFAHQHNIVHCDVKPENILFRANDEALMADFDIAKALSRANSAVSSPGGTSAYMAPEQFQGKVRKESDQYALGCIAYELLTGRRPFSGEDQEALMHAHLYEKPQAPTQVNAGLSAAMDKVILRALAKKYAERYEDIPGFLEALSAAAEVRAAQVVRSPLVLKNAAARREKDSAIYYEATELTEPEGEMAEAGTGHAAPAARKRRTTKAATGANAPAPRQVRTAVKAEEAHKAASKTGAKAEEVHKAASKTGVKAEGVHKVASKTGVKAEGVHKAASKKVEEAEPAETKKPVRRATSSAKVKKAALETAEAGEMAADKKAVSRKRAAAVAGHDKEVPAGEVRVRKARVAKEPVVGHDKEVPAGKGTISRASSAKKSGSRT